MPDATQEPIVEIQNPWYNPRNDGSHPTFRVGKPIGQEYGFTFYQTPGRASVLAVDAGGRAVTECVTQRGAVRELVRRGFINSEDYVDPDSVADAKPSPFIETCRRIVANQTAEKFDGIIIDMQSANAVVTVHDALGPERRVKFTSLNPIRAVEIAWKLISRAT